jgi:sRNA-binding carbon storage regulator CsrA
MALAVTRKLGESILIGTREEIANGTAIRVQLAQIFGYSKVRLCVTAPSDITILREEIVGNEPRTNRHA